MSRLLVVEDHALVREGLVAALSRLEGVTEVKEAADADSALDIVRRDDDLDCILLDLLLPGCRGFSCLNALRNLRPETPVVVVSGVDDRETMTSCLRLGASGFVPKTFNGEQLRHALRMVLAGGIYAPGAAGDDAPGGGRGGGGSSDSYKRALTGAQSRVLGLLAKGSSNREIAQRLGLTEGTVKIHLTAIYRRLGVTNRTQALLMLADPIRIGAMARRASGLSASRRLSTPADPDVPQAGR